MMNPQGKPEYRIYHVGLRSVIRDPTLSITAKVILVDLLNYAGVNGEAYPTQEQLADGQGIGQRRVRDMLTELKQRGLISWRRDKFRGANRYEFNPAIYCRVEEVKRRSTSGQPGSALPYTYGSGVPPKVSSEGTNQGSQLLKQLEHLRRKALSPAEVRQLMMLVARYGPERVREGLEKLRKRGKTSDISISYLEKVVADEPPNKRGRYSP
jgi:hypothetical protein